MADDQIRSDLRPLIDAMKAEQYDVAVEGLKKFLTLYPDHEVGTGLLASAYFQIGLVDRAQPLYERLVATYPLNALARFQLGMLRFTQREFRQAIEIWQPLLGAEDEFMAHFHSALAYLQLGETAAARPLLQRAAQTVPLNHPLAPQIHAAHTGLGSTPQ
jgi:tetratricopeptide (TPR) repeat protein